MGLRVDLQPKQSDLLDLIRNTNYTVIGYGGAQPLSGEISTPSGYVKMGDVIVGSEIHNPDGSNSVIKGITPRGTMDTYRVVFSDGVESLVTEDHLWYSWRAGRDEHHYRREIPPTRLEGFDKGKIYTTMEILRETERINERARKIKGPSPLYVPLHRFLIPVTKAVGYKTKKTLIDPYTLGVLLGDGYFPVSSDHAIRITSADIDIIKKVEQNNKTDLRVSKKRNNQAMDYSFRGSSLKPELNKYGLLGKKAWTKFIPNDYLINNIGIRSQLLQGLMDTDGHASSGKIYYNTTSEQLAKDFKQLIEGLGGVATVNKHNTSYRRNGIKIKGIHPVYKIYIKMQNPKEVFSLSRKQKKCKKPQGLYRRILNVEFAGRELCQCITVENPNGLYLMNNYIVTHNSNGGGKALGLSTLLPTPNGYMTMKESRVGDWIYGEDGKPTRIIWESGILENRPCYKITFSSGEQVVADGEHLWKTLDERERGLNHRRKERIRKKRNPGYNYKTLSSGSIKTTQELFHTVRYMGRANHSIACCEPIKNSKKELPIEPYLNGRSRNRYILDIQKIPSEPVKCIQIGNPDGMFLITKSFIPTHNSDGLRSVNMVLCTEKKNKPIKTLIFRRKSNDLLENHIVPFFQRYPELKKFFNKTERIIYWMDGSTTKFGSSDNEDDIQDFEGKEYDYIFVDEATHCTQYMLEYLKTRNRSGNVQAKCIYSMIPGFIGHLYIKRIFITKKYLDYEDPSDYVYLPARVWDNVVWVEDLLHYQGITVSQYYNEWTEDQRKEYTLLYSDYAKTLSHLPEQKRRARLYGDWFVFEGQFFENFNYDVHVVKKENYLSYEELANFQQAGGLDYGNVTSIQCVARDHNGNFILFDELHQEKMVRQEKIKETKEFLKKRELEKMILVGDTNMWIKDGFDVDVTSTPAYDYITAGLKLVKVSKTSPVKNKGYREACNDLINDLIFYEMEPDNPSKFKTKPKLLVYERCVHFLETFPSLIIDPKNPEDIEDGQSDHDFDSAKMVIMYLRTPIKKQEKNVPEWVKEMQQAKKIKLDGFMSV